SRRRHTRSKRDWSSDVCSSDLTSSCSDVSVRSKPVVVSVLVVVAMPVLQRVDADVPSIGVAREEVIAEELGGGEGRALCAVECEIGRASCRERVQSGGVAEAMK